MTDLLDDNQSDDNIKIDDNKDYLAELTGPGGKFDRSKYTSEEDMYKAIARGKVEADLFIANKNRQFDELRTDHMKLREEYNTGPKLQELLDQLTNRQQLASSESTLNANGVNEKPSLDLTEIENLVTSKIQETERTKKENENFNAVQSKLKERFGSNYQETLKDHIEQLGLTSEEATALAKRSPKAFFRTFGLDQEATSENFQAPPHTSQRSDNFSPSTNKRTWSYWQNVKKNNPNVYYSPKSQTQMFEDARVLGETFKDGDWSTWN